MGASAKADRATRPTAQAPAGLGDSASIPSAWTVAVGDEYHFTITPARDRSRAPSTDEFLNGVFPSRLDALESAIDGLEGRRRVLSASIARAKQMRSRLRRARDTHR